MVTSQYWFTGLLPVARDMVFQKRECVATQLKGLPITEGRKNTYQCTNRFPQ